MFNPSSTLSKLFPTTNRRHFYNDFNKSVQAGCSGCKFFAFNEICKSDRQVVTSIRHSTLAKRNPTALDLTAVDAVRLLEAISVDVICFHFSFRETVLEDYIAFKHQFSHEDQFVPCTCIELEKEEISFSSDSESDCLADLLERPARELSHSNVRLDLVANTPQDNLEELEPFPSLPQNKDSNALTIEIQETLVTFKQVLATPTVVQ